ncbi:MAG: DUF2207 domain-containing protein [Nevskiales bacterium]
MKRLLLLILMAVSASVYADERILNFHSDIQIHQDGSMTVVETIKVRAENKKIRRGIYRDFPTTYKTSSGKRHKVGFHVVGVRRDGQHESWHSKNMSNGIRVYFGQSDVMLKPGVYEYQFMYKTDRQLGFFEQHDELYWNVTGNDWAFPIDRASARVRLPATANGPISGEAYTGRHGAKGKDWRWQSQTAGGYFETTATLGKKEGLTIVLGWPKGLITEPSREDRLRWLWQDNAALVIVCMGTLGLLVYYLIAWSLVGRDPKGGVILPEYEPPAGYSPGALRLIRRMAFDNKALSAAIVNLAVQGALSIEEDDNEYSVRKQAKGFKPQHDDEHTLLDSFGSSLNFRKTNHKQVRKVIDAYKESLTGQYRKRYYYANTGWFIPGILISILIAAGTAWGLFHSHGPEAIFSLFMAIFITGFAAPFFVQLWRMRMPHQRGAGNWVRLVSTGIPLIFLFSMFTGSDLFSITDVIPWPIIGAAVVLVLVNALFGHLIKAPSVKGRQLLDRVEGFRQYLSLAEGDELKLRYSKPVTPEIFEAYLPYAIALDVETEWSERFAEDLRQAGEMPSQYRSHWYSGNDFNGVRGIASSVSGSLAASIASSSTAPGSSSGGGGGGFSGGGGGGGGGGGW